MPSCPHLPLPPTHKPPAQPAPPHTRHAHDAFSRAVELEAGHLGLSSQLSPLLYKHKGEGGAAFVFSSWCSNGTVSALALAHWPALPAQRTRKTFTYFHPNTAQLSLGCCTSTAAPQQKSAPKFCAPAPPSLPAAPPPPPPTTTTPQRAATPHGPNRTPHLLRPVCPPLHLRQPVLGGLGGGARLFELAGAGRARSPLLCL